MSNYELSPLFDTDSYKFSHWPQYPPNTEAMMSYMESRGGLGRVMMFCLLQYYVKRYLIGMPLTHEMVDEVAIIAQKHGVPFNLEGFHQMVNDYKGAWPVRIKAIPEGLVIPKYHPIMTIESTDKKYFWAVNWLETMFVRLW